ncbi:MAG: tetratricopeptide repeat protein [Kofleriaceae bacterium]
MRLAIVIALLELIACGANTSSPPRVARTQPPALAQPAAPETTANVGDDPFLRTAEERLTGPAAEVTHATIQVNLPAVPSFEVLVRNDGSHTVQELRTAGHRLLGSEITVVGHVTWVYDCVVDKQTVGKTRAQVQKAIDEDPTICERMKIYLGDSRGTAREKSLWVVDVPRPPNKLERQRLPKEQLRSWPVVPKFKVGEYVAITGTFALSSPHNERNSDGLLVYKAVERLRIAAAAQTTALASSPPAVLPPLHVQRVFSAPATRDALRESLMHSKRGAQAFGSKQYEVAQEHYTAAIKAWDSNHAAWYGLGGSTILRGDWQTASDALMHAYERDPDQAMYAMYAGIALYRGVITAAKEQQGKREQKRPDEVEVDYSKLDFNLAQQYLEKAIALNPDLWKAHYYLGSIFRDRGHAKSATEAFTRSVQHVPSDPGPWVALAEMYRRWDYSDQAILVAEQGTAVIPGDAGRSDVWFVVGMAYMDKGVMASAINALSHAIEARRDNAKAYLGRGQARFRTNQLAEAKRDLESFLSFGTSTSGFEHQQANRMLLDIAARRR